MVMTNPSLSPQPGICGLVRLCVREVSLLLVSFTHFMNVCGSAYENRCMVDGVCATASDSVLNQPLDYYYY